MSKRIICCAASVMLLSMGSRGVLAQNYAGDVTAAECVSIMSNAMKNPARSDTLSYTRHCVGFADSMVVLLRQTNRVHSDLATYDLVFRVASTYQEGPIYEAALVLARDSSEPDLARIAGLSILMSYVTVSTLPTYPSMLEDYEGDGDDCFRPSRFVSDFTYPGLSPLPVGFRDVILELARSILAGSSPGRVKCLAHSLVIELTPGPQAINQPEDNSFDYATDFEYVRRCGREFALRNRSYSYVGMIFEYIEGVPPSRGAQRATPPSAYRYRFNLPPRGEAESYSEVIWRVPGSWPDAVNVYDEDANLWFSAVPDNTPC